MNATKEEGGGKLCEWSVQSPVSGHSLVRFADSGEQGRHVLRLVIHFAKALLSSGMHANLSLGSPGRSEAHDHHARLSGRSHSPILTSCPIAIFLLTSASGAQRCD